MRRADTLLGLLPHVILDVVYQLVSQYHKDGDPDVEIVNIVILTLEHVYHAVSTVKELHSVWLSIRLFIVDWMRTFLDKEVQSGHDDFDILPDQGVILFDDNLVQNQVKQ